MIWVRGGIDTVQAMAERHDVAHIYANPAVRVDELSPAAGRRSRVARRPSSGTSPWSTPTMSGPSASPAAGAVVAGQDTGYLWSHPALVNQYRGGPGNHDYNWHDAIHSGGGSCGADSPEPLRRPRPRHPHHGHHGRRRRRQQPDRHGADGAVDRLPQHGRGRGHAGHLLPSAISSSSPPPTSTTRIPTRARRPMSSTTRGAARRARAAPIPNVLLTVVQNVRAAGIVTVHSAGNSGSSCSTVNEPSAIYGESFSVGATNSERQHRLVLEPRPGHRRRQQPAQTRHLGARGQHPLEHPRRRLRGRLGRHQHGRTACRRPRRAV